MAVNLTPLLNFHSMGPCPRNPDSFVAALLGFGHEGKSLPALIGASELLHMILAPWRRPLQRGVRRRHWPLNLTEGHRRLWVIGQTEPYSMIPKWGFHTISHK